MATETKKVEEPKKEEVKKEEKQPQDNTQLIKDLQKEVKALKKAQSDAVVQTVPGFVEDNQEQTTQLYSWEELGESAKQELLDERRQIVNDAQFRRPGSSFKENEATWVEMAVLEAYERDKDLLKKKGMHVFYEDLKECNYKKMLFDAVQEQRKYEVHLKNASGAITPNYYNEQHSGLNRMYERIVGNDEFNPNSEYNLIKAHRQQQKLNRYKYISVN